MEVSPESRELAAKTWENVCIDNFMRYVYKIVFHFVTWTLIYSFLKRGKCINKKWKTIK